MTDQAGEDDEFTVSNHNLVVAGPSGRYDFPDDYTFTTDGPSLHVLDGTGVVVMILASGAWQAAVSTGATFEWDTSDLDDEGELSTTGGDPA